MSALKPGTFCVIIAGCPESILLVVEAIQHPGRYEDREDAKRLSGGTRLVASG